MADFATCWWVPSYIDSIIASCSPILSNTFYTTDSLNLGTYPYDGTSKYTAYVIITFGLRFWVYRVIISLTYGFVIDYSTWFVVVNAHSLILFNSGPPSLYSISTWIMFDISIYVSSLLWYNGISGSPYLQLSNTA